MPLRDDLLQPVSADAPAGTDLSYDKLFDQIKDARAEDDESLPTGTWSRTLKRADRPLAIRLAGEALATRSKDLRLAGWYGESLLRREGFRELTPLVQLLSQLQETFWDSLFPLQDEDGDLGRRAGAVESAVSLLATQLRLLPLTHSGIHFVQAQDARTIPYERDATTQERKEQREEAVQRGRILPEDLDKAITDTPKSFYVGTEAYLVKADEALEELDGIGEQRYGGDPPNCLRLKSSIDAVRQFVSGVLVQKRKLEPDPELPSEDATAEPTPAHPSRSDEQPAALAPSTTIGQKGRPDLDGDGEGTVGLLGDVARPGFADHASAEPVPVPTADSQPEATQQWASAIRWFASAGGQIEVAYTLAAAPGQAVLFTAGPDFAWPPPSSQTRQSLRRLSRERRWAQLEGAALDALIANPGTIWLDLHRHLWQAAAELGQHALAAIVLATMRGYLAQVPHLGRAMLDDGTPMAAMETQDWLQALQPELSGAPIGTPAQVSAQLHAALRTQGSKGIQSWKTVDPFENALKTLQQGSVSEAIGMLSREAEEQPTGRMRFQRRLETAELCLEAGHAAVAQPLLADLSAEVERRTLEGWEAASLLARPLALTIRCVDQGVTASDSRETLFSRLCRLDPVAAAALDRSSPEKVK